MKWVGMWHLVTAVHLWTEYQRFVSVEMTLNDISFSDYHSYDLEQFLLIIYVCFFMFTVAFLLSICFSSPDKDFELGIRIYVGSFWVFFSSSIILLCKKTLKLLRSRDGRGFTLTTSFVDFSGSFVSGSMWLRCVEPGSWSWYVDVFQTLTFLVCIERSLVISKSFLNSGFGCTLWLGRLL